MTAAAGHMLAPNGPTTRPRASRRVFALATGPERHARDAGFVLIPPPPTVRGRVTQDSNSDSIRQSGEAGVAGGLVDLIDTATGWTVTVETDANGDYEFAGVAPGRTG